jgi:hypothetical protein
MTWREITAVPKEQCLLHLHPFFFLSSSFFISFFSSSSSYFSSFFLFFVLPILLLPSLPPILPSLLLLQETRINTSDYRTRIPKGKRRSTTLYFKYM